MFRFKAFVPLMLAVALAACGRAPYDPNTLNRGNGLEPKSLDPHFIDGTWEANILGDLLIGLATEDAAGKPIPGAALSWEMSPDGLTWTFHMRPHLWSDGQPVTAADFVTAWRRLVDPKTPAPYAYNMWLIKNAEAIDSGKMPVSSLGVKAVDDRTLVVQLEHPAAYLPELLMHQTAYPIPRHLYLKIGDAWSLPQNYVDNGPYNVKEWIPGDHVTLVKNPRFYDAAHVRINTVVYYSRTDSEAALKQFRAGELDMQNPYPAVEIDWMRKNIPNDIKSVPYLGISYLLMNFQNPIMRDRRLREALNLAFDREAIAYKIRRIGELPAYGMLPPGVANYPGGAALDFKSLSDADRIKKAQSLMAQMGYGPGKHLQLDYLTSTNPDSTRSASVVQRMMTKIYVDMKLDAVEGQILYQRLQQRDFEIGGAAWIADFNDASNILDLLRSDSGNNYGAYSNPAYDALLNKAQMQTDLKLRGQLMAQAEQMALNDYAWIPGYFLVTQDIVQPYVKNWIPNIRGFNRSRWLWLDGKKPPS
ncbi:MAG TPA: peptide ABC transporter substrate-binding protein [Rhizomicrobium sp.]